MSGELPADWSKRELGDFAKATGGSRFPPTAQGSKEGDYPFYKVSDMNLPGNEQFMGVANHWITEATRKKIKAKTFPAGSVIFPKIGAAVATNKKRLLTQESIIDNNVMAIVVDDPDVCSFRYLRFWFETIDLRDLSNSGALPSIPGHRVHTMHVPLPPLPEQNKIAHILSTVQRAIEAQQRIIQTTTELKKALMHKLFTEGIRNEPQKQTKIGLVPESWEVKPLIDTVEFIDYGVSQAIPKTRTPEGVKIVSTADIDKQGNLLYWKIRRIVVPEKAANRLILKDGDVLFNWRNSAELIGKSTIYEEQDEPHIFASFILRICAGEKKSHNYFLKHLMNHYREEGVFVKLARRAVNQANYNKNEISVLKIPSPPYEQQVEIAKAIGAVDAKVWSHVAKKRSLEDLFRTLLHELMTAKTRVHELDTTGFNR